MTEVILNIFVSGSNVQSLEEPLLRSSSSCLPLTYIVWPRPYPLLFEQARHQYLAIRINNPPLSIGHHISHLIIKIGCIGKSLLQTNRLLHPIIKVIQVILFTHINCGLTIGATPCHSKGTTTRFCKSIAPIICSGIRMHTPDENCLYGHTYRIRFVLSYLHKTKKHFLYSQAPIVHTGKRISIFNRNNNCPCRINCTKSRSLLYHPVSFIAQESL